MEHTADFDTGNLRQAGVAMCHPPVPVFFELVGTCLSLRGRLEGTRLTSVLLLSFSIYPVPYVLGLRSAAERRVFDLSVPV
jgi:hypothetical protein